MIDDEQRDLLAEKINLSNEMEKIKRRSTKMASEKELLITELQVSKNKEIESISTVDALKVKLDGAQHANAAVRTAVLSAEIVNLNSVVKQLKEEAHRASTEKSGLLFELESTKSNQIDPEDSRKQINDLLAIKERLTTEVFETRKLCFTTKTKIDVLQVNIAELDGKIKLQVDEIKSCKSEAFLYTKKSESDRADMMIKYASAQNKLDITLNKLENVIADNISTETTMIANNEIMIANYDKQISDYKQKEILNQTATNKLNTEIEENKQEIQVISKRSNEKGVEVFILKMALESYTGQINDFITLIDSLETWIVVEFERFEERISSSNINLKNIEIEITKTRETLLSAQADNIEIRSINESILQELETKFDEITRIENDLKLLMEQNEKLSTEIVKLNEESNNFRGSSDEKIKNYESQITAKNNEFENLKKNHAEVVDTLKNDAEITTLHNEFLTENLKIESELAVRTLQEELVRSHQDLEVSTKCHEEHVHNLNSTMSLLQWEKNSACAHYDAVIEEKTNENQKIGNCLEFSEKENNNLLAQINEIQILNSAQIVFYETNLKSTTNLLQISNENESNFATQIDEMSVEINHLFTEMEKAHLEASSTQKVTLFYFIFT